MRTTSQSIARVLSHATLIATFAAALALQGCATIDTATQKVGGVFGSKSDTTRSATGGAIIGCGAGAVLGRIIGNGSDMLKGCAAGAAVGAISAVKIHQHEVEKARALAAQAEAVKGVKATVTTKPVQVKDEEGKPAQVDALDRLTIDLPAAGVKSHAADVASVLDKAATLADGASDPTTIEVRGTQAQRTWIASRIRAHLRAGSTVRVIEVAGKSPRLVISPIPKSEG